MTADASAQRGAAAPAIVAALDAAAEAAYRLVCMVAAPVIERSRLDHLPAVDRDAARDAAVYRDRLDRAVQYGLQCSAAGVRDPRSLFGPASYSADADGGRWRTTTPMVGGGPLSSPAAVEMVDRMTARHAIADDFARCARLAPSEYIEAGVPPAPAQYLAARTRLHWEAAAAELPAAVSECLRRDLPIAGEGEQGGGRR